MIKFYIVIGSLFSLGLHAQVFDSLILEESLQFYYPTGNTDFEDGQTDLFGDLLNKLNANKKVVVKVVGHTDDVGTALSNEQLSLQRAENFKNKLLENNISSNRIFTEHYGELKPAVLNTPSLRQNNRRVEVSLYLVRQLRVIKGVISDDSIAIASKIKIKVESKNFLDSTYSDENGVFKIAVPEGEFVEIKYHAPGYLQSIKRIKVSSALEKRDIKLNMPQLHEGRIFEFEQFYFKGGTPILLPSSLKTLDQLYETLKDELVCVEIRGHVNVPGDRVILKTESDFILSEFRAAAIFEEMVERGVDPKIMKHRGYGNEFMPYPMPLTEDQASRNRRVEIKVIKCDF